MDMTALWFAKLGAVMCVFYAGANIFQLWARFEEVRQRAQQFATIAGDPANAARLVWIRSLFYFGIPVAFIVIFFGAGLPAGFLLASGCKFSMSAGLGLRAERRVLAGNDYRSLDHRLSRLDALLNLMVAAAAVLLLLERKY